MMKYETLLDASVIRAVVDAVRVFNLPENVVFCAISDVPEMQGIHGACAYDPRRNEILISLKTSGRSFWDILLTLCHEIVHAEDYAAGRLGAFGSPLVYYMGKQYAFGDLEYPHEMPWEVKAFNNQDNYLVYLLRYCSQETFDLFQESAAETLKKRGEPLSNLAA